MTRYINACDLIEKLCEHKFERLCPEIVDIVAEAPTADVKEVVFGKWHVTEAYPHRLFCGHCFKTNVRNIESLPHDGTFPKYCMWCGAEMEEFVK